MFTDTNDYPSSTPTPDSVPQAVILEPKRAVLSEEEQQELAMMACAHIHDLDAEADRIHDENVRRRRLEYHIRQSPNVLPLPFGKGAATPTEHDHITHTA